MLDVRDLSNNGWFVVTSYVVAFSPWAVYGAVDHVGGRWMYVSVLAGRTVLATATLFVSLFALTAYIVVQFAAEDWKEGMAAVVVLLATWLPIMRVSRQLWFVHASATLGRLLSGISTQLTPREPRNGGKFSSAQLIPWKPRNSNKFFDNDRPGEGISDISLISWWKELREFREAQKSLSSSTRALGDVGYEPSDSEYDRAMAVVRYRLRLVTAATRYHREFQHPMLGADNGFKRLVWLFDNLVSNREAMQMLLCLGLCVHSCLLLCGPDDMFESDLSWINWLQGRENSKYVQDGHLKSCRMLQAMPLETELPDTDYHEAYALLPAERASREQYHHLKWQDVMYVVSSTLELHTLTVALSAPNRFGEIGSPDFVRQHVLGAIAGNSKRAGDRVSVGEFLASGRTTQVFQSLFQDEAGKKPGECWERLYSSAYKLAIALTTVMRRRTSTPETSEVVAPANALRSVLRDILTSVVARNDVAVECKIRTVW